jgi:phage-related protein
MFALALSGLATWLATQLLTGRTTFREIWQKFCNFGFTIWGVITMVAGWLWFVCTSLVDMVGDVATTILEVIIPGTAINQGIATYSSLANTFVPLSEAMAFLVGYLGLHLALMGYRLVKSWIPTLS